MSDTIKAKRLSLHNHPEYDHHMNVVMFKDDATNLKAIIAIHDTTMGPSLGGCRFLPYAQEEDAITDVLRLSRGMTYKSALAGLALGGGKSVILGDPKSYTPQARDALMLAMGHAVASLQGEYIIAEDMNTNEHDMDIMSSVSPHVGGLTRAGNAIGGNPSPITALGVYSGLKAAVKHKLGKDSVKGVKVAVQGLGSVGMTLCQHLHDDGAELFVTDINPATLETAKERFGATVVGLDEIYSIDADVFAPCARGAILNDETIPKLKVSIVAGAANNQLAKSVHGQMLTDRGILYAPDYVVNAGGVMIVAGEVLGAESLECVMNQVRGIYDTSLRVFEYAARKGITTATAADEIAQEMIRTKKYKTAAA